MLGVAIGASACGGVGEQQRDESSRPARLGRAALVERARESAVRLSRELQGVPIAGRGILVDAERGLVLTNAHVVGGLRPLRAAVPGNPPTRARVLAAAPCRDLAMVELVRGPRGARAMPLARCPRARATT